MKAGILSFILCCGFASVTFASNSWPLEKAPINLKDNLSLQRGAQLYMNYCMGCHSLKYQRYQRVAQDLDLTDAQVEKNLIFSDQKIGARMEIAMQAEEGKQWFGVAPPDLTLLVRARSADWLYTYLKSFYQDESRPWGVNNTVFPDVGMPHVLLNLQGKQRAIYETIQQPLGEQEKIVALELIEPGQLSPAEYDTAVADLVNFLSYSAEPIKLKRQRLGLWVMLFCILFIVVTYLLKKEYWRDIQH